METDKAFEKENSNLKKAETYTGATCLLLSRTKKLYQSFSTKHTVNTDIKVHTAKLTQKQKFITCKLKDPRTVQGGITVLQASHHQWLLSLWVHCTQVPYFTKTIFTDK